MANTSTLYALRRKASSLLLLLASLQTPAAHARIPLHHGWQLAWSDDFKGKPGAALDPTKWTPVTGGRGWGNNELETYTTRPQNLHLDHGNLVITAIKEDFTGADGIARPYTSARLQTAGKFQQAYGRFEARIRIPRGQGIWPAFWLLGADHETAAWPRCGELDIMENIGKEPGTVHGSMHGPGYSGAHPLTGKYTLPNGAAFADSFHTFAVEWDPNTVRFYVDDQLYETQTPAVMPPGATWVFDHPFFVLLNLAVGGNWPGNPDATTQFPQQMLVDYVAVYIRRDLAKPLATNCCLQACINLSGVIG